MVIKKVSCLKTPVVALLALWVLFEFYAGVVSSFFHYVVADLDSETTGLITISELKSAPRSVRYYYIRYTYEIDGVKYFSTIVDYNDKTFRASETVRQYYPGQEVRVYYDSSLPFLAVLNKTPLSLEISIRMALSFCVFLLFLLREVFKKQLFRS